MFIGRSIKHSLRSIDSMVTALALPLIILLMFVYVFGGAIQADGRYIDYVVPGIILLAAGFGSAETSVTVATDMTTGVIDRFRSLPVAAASVLVGHVTATVLRNLVSSVLVLGLALALGFRPHAGVLAWLGVAGLLALFMSAIAWLAATFGLLAKSAEGAAAFGFIVMFLPYVSSAFVPPATMPGFLRPSCRAPAGDPGDRDAARIDDGHADRHHLDHRPGLVPRRDRAGRGGEQHAVRPAHRPLTAPAPVPPG